jgi:hypothetical protein
MIYILAIISHFLFDWVLQDREIAKTKSTDTNALVTHILFQIIPYLLIVFCTIQIKYHIKLDLISAFLFINTVSHALIDWYLPKLFKPELSERRMIDMVAVDQILHLVILFLSIDYLLNLNKVNYLLNYQHI